VAAPAIRQEASAFLKAAETSFGSYEIWKADFVGIGKMRGVGWAICYQNPANGRLSNPLDLVA
jgi:Fe-Mn family superoxide dismutase